MIIQGFALTHSCACGTYAVLRLKPWSRGSHYLFLALVTLINYETFWIAYVYLKVIAVILTKKVRPFQPHPNVDQQKMILLFFFPITAFDHVHARPCAPHHHQTTTPLMPWAGTLLRDQHTVDLETYRSAHQHESNRRLHHVLIPLEVASFLWLATTALYGWQLWWYRRRDVGSLRKIHEMKNHDHLLWLVETVAWTLGLLSWAVATDPLLGCTVLTLHVVTGKLCKVYVLQLGPWQSAMWGTLVWSLSWTLQVGVGHYLWEQRPPNLGTDPLSFLSMVTSIVVAWES